MTDHPLKTPANARSTPLVIRERVWWLLPLVLWAVWRTTRRIHEKLHQDH